MYLRVCLPRGRNKICPRSRISGCNLLALEPLESGCTGPVNYGSRHSRNPPVTCALKELNGYFFIPRQSRRDIVLASSVHTFCLSGTISQYLLVRFDSFLVQIISTINSRYPISLVKIDPLTLELLPLFKYRQL